MKINSTLVSALLAMSVLISACSSAAPERGDSLQSGNVAAASVNESNVSTSEGNENGVGTSETNENGAGSSEENGNEISDDEKGLNRFPEKLADIPEEYWQETEQKGTLQDLYYDTYESFSYEEKSQKLQKHAVVYLPYGYDEKKNIPCFTLCTADGAMKPFI